MLVNLYRVQPLDIAAITDLDPALFAGDGAPRDTAAPDDIIHDNTRKAGFAATALSTYANRVGDTREDFDVIVSDLIADLHHLADALDIDLADAIRHGRDDYLAEIGPARVTPTSNRLCTSQRTKGSNSMSEVKITKLTKDNVRALKETMSREQADKVRLTATTAVFAMTAGEAVMMICYLQSQAAHDHGAMVHPYKSLNAVRRKLETIEAADTLESPPAVSPSPAPTTPPVLAELLRLDSHE